MKNYFTTICILLIALTINIDLYGNWKAIYKRDKITSVLYNLQDDSAYRPLKEKFYFQHYYDDIDTLFNNGYKTVKFKKASFLSLEKGKSCFWHKKLISPILLKQDTSVIYFKLFVKNVKNYTVYLHTINNQWYKKNFIANYQHYQTPVELLANNWEAIDTVSQEKDNHFFIFPDSLAQREIDEFLIVVKPIDVKNFSFIFNNFIIGDRISEENECRHPFFDRLFCTPGKSDQLLLKNCLNSNPYSNSLLITEESYKLEFCANYFEFKKESNSDSEIELIRKLIFQVIEDYPFYHERKLNKELIFNKFQKLSRNYDELSSINEFSNTISSFINNEFNDGHFYLVPPSSSVISKKTTSSPIRLFEIRDKVLVAAIFDTIYQKQISLGDEVVAIDNISIKYVIDSLQRQQYGVTERKRARAVSISLRRIESDFCVITTINKDGFKQSTTIKYDAKLTIPDNFRPIHCNFDIDENNIAYFRANRMDGAVFLRFFNHYQQIKNSNGLVIDLRGNPGGSSSDGENIFSLFIDKPMVYHHTVSLKNKGLESLVIKPHKSHHFNNKLQVILLGDCNTACASEDFIQAMQQLDNVQFLGTSKTCGALQSRHSIRFPSGTYMSIDCLSPKIFSNKVGIVECKGIDPDIWIQPTTVYDLAPYNNTVVKAAKKLLSYAY